MTTVQTTAGSATSREFDHARRLERGLGRVRWFAVALGLYLVSQTNAGPPPHASRAVIWGSYAIVVALGLGNVVVTFCTGRARTLRAQRTIGLLAFAMDAAVILAFTWLYSYDPKGPTWVVVYILPLEGALRYRLGGAVATVALTLLNETAREVFLAHRFAHPIVSGGAHIDAYPFLVPNVVMRVGIQGIIALVAGFMARSLARQAERSEQQAQRFQELARREASAKSELAAFNTAILAGVAAEDLETSFRLMAGAIGRDLGFETFSILLREGDHLVVKGMWGMPFFEGGVPVGSGVTGTAASTGRAIVVPDVHQFPGYIEADPEMRSEMAAPMRIGEDVIGVLDVESRTPGAFDEHSVGVLTRLADQIGLVAQANLLLAQQVETVRRLQELDQMKSDFVAITSHELRTPITAIRGFVETLTRNRGRLSEDQVDSFMQIIDRQSGRLARLVDDLLVVSRIEAGTVRLSLEPVELPAFLQEVAEALGPEGRTRIVLDLDPKVGTVVMDPQRVEQVLRNLIDNALKFSPADGPVVVRAATSGDRIEITVSDRGDGIPSDELPRIFDRFHQTGSALTREKEGAGLGLYITKRLVEAMGGSIRATSAPGEGSAFSVRLPANATPGVSEPAALTRRPAEPVP
jgi:signal transduction histidine kinase